MKRLLVVSAVNFTEGGPLTVLRHCVAAARAELPDWRIVVMAHRRELLGDVGVEVMEFPQIKGSWFRRLQLEWSGFNKLSKKLKPDLWLSLHDVTPRVEAREQAVYCHNPSIFYTISLREALQEPKFLLFNLFYGLVYGTFIRRNRRVIVQQEWLREEFRRRFRPHSIVVAHPSNDVSATHGDIRPGGKTIFLYPSLPRVFKNLEALGEAAILLNRRGIAGFEIRMTVDGTENAYARWLKRKFDAVPGLSFIGRQDSAQMRQQYDAASALVFPSRLETWGLPITEAKNFGLPILVADAPYAHETVGTYDTVSFFPLNDAEALADQMQALIERTWKPLGNRASETAAPFASDWSQLIRILTENFRNQPSAELK